MYCVVIAMLNYVQSNEYACMCEYFCVCATKLHNDDSSSDYLRLVPGGWMTIPQGLSNCPPGLEYLSLIDQLLVHQRIELLEAFVGFETNNKYTVMNNVACDSCLCPCWLQTMEVYSPPGTLIGSVEQEWSICKPNYAIKNALGDVVLRIKGPFCTFSMCGDVKFNVGTIKKQWSGIAREAFTDADMFGISFPMDLDVKIKAGI
ncbi:Phospholipid scramblase 2 [Operophtera brumata]|uniref:Phospholipid scramblase n=1 Tax=Operophtera brumata TaxID=104452 RepID=A0A0L7LN07_OPEBR|nr:Phospholipid scramblase 2 [Operophtera brumata]